MTHTPSAAARRCRRRRDFGRDRTARGFTLIEVIVVMVVIAVLAAIVVPAVFKARSTATRLRTGADLASIGTALEEYKKDHGGQYPQVTQVNTGFAVLGRALIGTYGDGVLPSPPNAPNTPDSNDPPALDTAKEYLPGDCISSGVVRRVCLERHVGKDTAQSRYWADFTPTDGLDGPGHAINGRKYPPYLQPERFRVRGTAIVDANDKPILYLPKLANVNVRVREAHMSLGGPSMYNANSVAQFFARPKFETPDPDYPKELLRVRAIVGDTNGDGDYEDTGEAPKTTGDFILWAAGPDGFYGPFVNDPSRDIATNTLRPEEVSKCDDVTNFAR